MDARGGGYYYATSGKLAKKISNSMLLASVRLSISKEDILFHRTSPRDIFEATARLPGWPVVGMIEGLK
jgi:hypothetical protein